MRFTTFICLLFFGQIVTKACIWDRDTLADERKKSPQIAELLFGPEPKPADPRLMRARIESLRRDAKENDPAWWNDLAGAYIRLGNAAEAAKLLESVVVKFPNDYGIHANLGTAYHLLGRYTEAEREIARDLELSPDGHFGLEKYHLALLQYLSADADYQKDHVYVDEFSSAFTNGAQGWSRFRYVDPSTETNDVPERPAYRKMWNLATDTNLQAGVVYMASLNPKQPACFVMLGIVSLKSVNQDLHLAKAAFEKAIRLGSPQESYMRAHIGRMSAYQRNAPFRWWAPLLGILCLLGGFVGIIQLRRWRRDVVRKS
jgi:tetratricopeptide (TPR) repeat protein